MRALTIGFGSMALFLASALSHASTWDIDTSHGLVGFAVKHMMLADVRGNFGKFNGTMNMDEKDVTKSTVNVDIDTASVDTDESKRDDHLRSPDFFDSSKFPKMTFRSTKVEQAANGALKVHGDLTIRGVSKPVVLMVEGPAKPIKDPWGNQRTMVKANTTIKRADYGLTWNKTLEAGGVLVGDQVNIQIEVELIKKDKQQG